MSDPGQPQDDPSIDDDHQLWRRIPPYWLVTDTQTGEVRPSSAAFQDHPTGSAMSVTLGTRAIEQGYEPHDALTGHDGFSLAAFRAGLARELGQGVRDDPLPDQICHGEVLGKKNQRVKKSLSKAATWVVLRAPSLA